MKIVDSSPNPVLTTQRNRAHPTPPLQKPLELHMSGQFVKCIQIEASATVTRILPTLLFTIVTFVILNLFSKDANLSTIIFFPPPELFFLKSLVVRSYHSLPNLRGYLRYYPKKGKNK